jgi:hypothetical protein
MRTLYVAAAIALVSVAIAICFLLGTIGWFVIGLGVLTDCTNNYSCSATNCAPCRTTGLWINAGGLAELLLAATGIGVLTSARQVRTSARRRCDVAVLRTRRRTDSPQPLPVHGAGG